jgi:membrane-bound inhibitor of C-type lysozyme
VRPILRVAYASLVLAGLAGCVAEGDGHVTGALASAAGTASETAGEGPADIQPRQASYHCDDDGVLVVQNMRSSVTLIDPDGDTVTLPAAPASQQSRYGQAGYALVLEGSEALYMKGGKEPMTCRR